MGVVLQLGSSHLLVSLTQLTPQRFDSVSQYSSIKAACILFPCVFSSGAGRHASHISIERVRSPLKQGVGDSPVCQIESSALSSLCSHAGGGRLAEAPVRDERGVGAADSLRKFESKLSFFVGVHISVPKPERVGETNTAGGGATMLCCRAAKVNFEDRVLLCHSAHVRVRVPTFESEVHMLVRGAVGTKKIVAQNVKNNVRFTKSDCTSGSVRNRNHLTYFMVGQLGIEGAKHRVLPPERGKQQSFLA